MTHEYVAHLLLKKILKFDFSLSVAILSVKIGKTMKVLFKRIKTEGLLVIEGLKVP